MFLKNTEQNASDKIRIYIQKHNSKLELERIKCKICMGTGLDKVYKNSDGSFCGDINSYCYKCQGIGYVTYNQNEMFKCFRCNGSGIKPDCVGNVECNLCNGSGLINWLENVIGK